MTSNAAFLAAIFDDLWPDEYLWSASFVIDPKRADKYAWAGKRCTAKQVSNFPCGNGYYSVAALRPLDGVSKRRKTHFSRLFVLVLDDVTDCPLIPTYRLRTSNDSCHIGFKLTEPLADLGIADRLHKALSDSGRIKVAADDQGNNPVRYVRLPVQENTKYDPPFKSVLEHFEPTITYTVAELIEGLGLDADAILAPMPTQTKEKAAGAIEEDWTVSADTVRDLRSALLFLRADSYGDWIDVGHALKVLGETGRGLWLEWSATSKLFDPSEASDKWDSFNPTDTGYQAVFAKAQKQGWVNPASKDSAPVIDPAKLLPALEENLLSLANIDQADPFDTMPHYVDRWIPQDEVTLLAGHGGGGKSYVALSIAIHVALGLSFGPLETTQANVLFYSAEDSGRVLSMRLRRLCHVLKINPADLDGKLFLLDASDLDPALHREQRAGTNCETSMLYALAQLAENYKIGLTVVDNASDAYDDDEIKRAKVRAFIRSLRARIARPGRAVLLLAHINKSSAKARQDAEDYSGSTAWHNSVRSRLSLVPGENSSMLLEHVKANLGAKADPIRMEWIDSVPLVTESGSTYVGDPERAAEKRRQQQAAEAADRLAVMAVIKDFVRRGEQIPTATSGPCPVQSVLGGHDLFPKGVRPKQLVNILRHLETGGQIVRTIVKTANRKTKEVFSLPESAPVPELKTYKAETRRHA